MTSKIAAVFDAQVFRPTEPIELPVNTRVQITIEIHIPHPKVLFHQWADDIKSLVD